MLVFCIRDRVPGIQAATSAPSWARLVDSLEVVFDTGLTIFTYTADPGTRSAEALALLGSLAATTTAEQQTPAS